jgi:hypothetical protein
MAVYSVKRLFAAREQDAHQGWVWLKDATLPARGIIKIVNKTTRASVYCEALQIDDNFLKQYNRSPRIPITDPASILVIGAWYRKKLGHESPQSDVTLKISSCNSAWGHFKACTDHPQSVVRLSSWLGFLGLALGVLGLFIAFI